jgi:hypothetical protein
MQFLSRYVPILVFAIAASSTPLLAQDELPAAKLSTTMPSAAAKEPKVLTGKERLSKKWLDEQRIDNCKVPIDKRGTKPRPDTCAHVPTG